MALSSSLPAHQLPLSFLASDKPALPPLVLLVLEQVAVTICAVACPGSFPTTCWSPCPCSYNRPFSQLSSVLQFECVSAFCLTDGNGHLLDVSNLTQPK